MWDKVFIVCLYSQFGNMEKDQITTLGRTKLDNKNRITLSSDACKILNVSSGDFVSVETTGRNVVLKKAYWCVRRNNNCHIKQKIGEQL